MATSATVGVSGTQGTQTEGYDAFKNLKLEDFLAMMLAELQNQDPLNPMDNTQLLEQVNQIEEIASNQRLTETLQGVQLGQSLASASAMIGKWIVGLSDEGERVAGLVDRITIEDSEAKVHVGDYAIALTNISEIASEAQAVAEK